MKYSMVASIYIEAKKSPRKMAIRLNYAGMRDINLLADLTNYVMLDLGLPMHAFDNNVVKVSQANREIADVINTLVNKREF